MVELGPWGVKGYRPGLFGFFHHLAFGNEVKFGVRVNESCNEPWTGHAVDVDFAEPVVPVPQERTRLPILPAVRGERPPGLIDVKARALGSPA